MRTEREGASGKEGGQLGSTSIFRIYHIILVVYKYVVQKKMVTWTRVVKVEGRKGGLLHQF